MTFARHFDPDPPELPECPVCHRNALEAFAVWVDGKSVERFDCEHCAETVQRCADCDDLRHVDDLVEGVCCGCRAPASEESAA